MKSIFSPKFLFNFENPTFREVFSDLDKRWKRQDQKKFVRMLKEYPDITSELLQRSKKMSDRSPCTKYSALRIMFQYLDLRLSDGGNGVLNCDYLIYISLNLAQKYFEEKHLCMTTIVELVNEGGKFVDYEAERDKVIELEYDVLDKIDFDVNKPSVLDYVNFFLGACWNIPQFKNNDDRKDLIYMTEHVYGVCLLFACEYLNEDVKLLASALIWVTLRLLTENKSELSPFLVWIKQLVGEENFQKTGNISNLIHETVERRFIVGKMFNK